MKTLLLITNDSLLAERHASFIAKWGFGGQLFKVANGHNGYKALSALEKEKDDTLLKKLVFLDLNNVVDFRNSIMSTLLFYHDMLPPAPTLASRLGGVIVCSPSFRAIKGVAAIEDFIEAPVLKRFSDICINRLEDVEEKLYCRKFLKPSQTLNQFLEEIEAAQKCNNFVQVSKEIKVSE